MPNCQAFYLAMPNNNYMKESNEWVVITQNILELVNASEKSKTQVAQETGITKATLSQYLSGRAFPSLATLKNLCRALDCNYDDILGKLED